MSHPRSNSRFHAFRGGASTALITLTFAFIAACGDDSSTGQECANATPNTVEATTFAPELQVDVSQLTVNNAGVYFQDLVVGTGPIAEAGDVATVGYTGWLSDGTRFDGNDTFPFVIGLGQVIIGWDRGVEGMQVGGIRKLVLPPAVAYGLCDFGPIPGNSILVFDVELKAIN